MITHTSHEFATMTRAYAILVGVLDAKGFVDARAIAANLRVGAGEIEGCEELHEIMATVVTNVIEKYDREGPSKLSVVDQSPD